MVEENRYLRKENTRLQEIEKKYSQSILEARQINEENYSNILKTALMDCTQNKSKDEFIKDLLGQL